MSSHSEYKLKEQLKCDSKALRIFLCKRELIYIPSSLVSFSRIQPEQKRHLYNYPPCDFQQGAGEGRGSGAWSGGLPPGLLFLLLHLDAIPVFLNHRPAVCCSRRTNTIAHRSRDPILFFFFPSFFTCLMFLRLRPLHSLGSGVAWRLFSLTAQNKELRGKNIFLISDLWITSPSDGLFFYRHSPNYHPPPAVFLFPCAFTRVFCAPA